MITFSKFGKPGSGRLGNQLFQWASLYGMSLRYNEPFSTPKWQYSSFFKTPPDSRRIRSSAVISVNEPHYHYTPEVFDEAIKEPHDEFDIWGWLQTEKYWDADQKGVQQMMQFTDEHLAHVRRKYPVLDAGAPIIAISIRRGDYVDNENYYQLPIDYYVHALYDQFDGFQDMANVMIFSDDFEYCKLHLDALPNVVFAEGSAMEQLAAMTLCDHFIIANSTFSWWGAYLGEKETSLIVRPAYHFAGEMEKLYDWKDYYPNRWEVFNHMNPHNPDQLKKMYLMDVTFTIPYRRDSQDREQNLEAVVSYLKTHFNTIVTIMSNNDMKVPFHRTKYLNEMAADAITPIIANWDTDVMVPIVQIMEAARAIRLKKAAMVFPYDGRFARVPRTDFKIDQKESTHKDLSTLVGKTYRGMFQGDTPSVGGAIFWDRETFLDIGGENENFIDYGPEDVERFHRAQKLRIPIWRTPGVLYHFDHHVPKGSQKDNPHYEANERQLRMVQSMSRHNLLEYIKTWPWRHMYSAKYYATFAESAAVSAVEVFKHYMTQFPKSWIPGTVLDIGCGLGEWASVETLGWKYRGLDFRVPKESLRIPLEKYIEMDLTTLKQGMEVETADLIGRADVVLCLEVAEHLPEEVAHNLVRFLTSLGEKVLFSAAIPHQGGEGHVNEQWQSYWGDLFSKEGYVGTQPWERGWDRNEKIDLWYRQNMILFISDDPFLDIENTVNDYVHPEMYLRIIDHYKNQ